MQEEITMSLKYEKPLIIPLNSVGDETGLGACSPGGSPAAGKCSAGGTAPGGNCQIGTAAGGNCLAGGIVA